MNYDYASDVSVRLKIEGRKVEDFRPVDFKVCWTEKEANGGEMNGGGGEMMVIISMRSIFRRTNCSNFSVVKPRGSPYSGECYRLTVQVIGTRIVSALEVDVRTPSLSSTELHQSSIEQLQHCDAARRRRPWDGVFKDPIRIHLVCLELCR